MPSPSRSAFDEDVLLDSELYDADPRSASEASAEAKQVATQVRQVLGRSVLSLFSLLGRGWVSRRDQESSPVTSPHLRPRPRFDHGRGSKQLRLAILSRSRSSDPFGRGLKLTRTLSTIPISSDPTSHQRSRLSSPTTHTALITLKLRYVRLTPAVAAVTTDNCSLAL